MAKQGKADPSQVYNYLRARGVPKEHAQGMIANIQHESAFDPGAKGDYAVDGKLKDADGNRYTRNSPGAKPTAVGLFQHQGVRRDALLKFAEDNNLDAYDWKTQVEYALTEPDTDRYLKKEFKDAQAATKDFTINWERPAAAQKKAEERAEWVAGTDFQEPDGYDPVKLAQKYGVPNNPKERPVFKQSAATELEVPTPEPESLDRGQPPMSEDLEAGYEAPGQVARPTPRQPTSGIDVQGRLAQTSGPSEAVAAERVAAEEEGFGEYTVKKGDTLSRIAQRFGLDWRKVAKANKLQDPNQIMPGQKLMLRENAPFAPDRTRSGMFERLAQADTKPLPGLPEPKYDEYMGQAFGKKLSRQPSF